MVQKICGECVCEYCLGTNILLRILTCFCLLYKKMLLKYKKYSTVHKKIWDALQNHSSSIDHNTKNVWFLYRHICHYMFERVQCRWYLFKSSQNVSYCSFNKILCMVSWIIFRVTNVQCCGALVIWKFKTELIYFSMDTFLLF